MKATLPHVLKAAGRAVLTAALLLQASYSSASNDAPTPKTSELQQQIQGPDANGNRIRDDVDEFIARTYSGVTPVRRAAVVQMARAMQGALVVDVSNSAELKTAQQNMSRALNCVFSTFTGSDGTPHPTRVFVDIESRVADTQPRRKAYQAYNKALDGSTQALAKGNTCDVQGAPS